MHKYGIKIGEQIGLSTKEFRLNNKEVQRMFVKIVRRKSDSDILRVVGKYLGEGFVDKVLESIDKWEERK